MRQLQAALYRLGSRIHWPERERAVAGALDALATLMSEPPRRVVDIGCGPGLLADAVLARRLDYLGVEPDPAFIEHARARFTHDTVRFHRATVSSMDVDLAATDIVVANGVAHHLGDEDMDLLLRTSSRAGAMVVCDHRCEPGVTGIVASALQAADRGRFVRDFSYFSQLAGFDLRACDPFVIGLCGVPLWPYFCATYTPRGDRP